MQKTLPCGCVEVTVFVDEIINNQGHQFSITHKVSECAQHQAERQKKKEAEAIRASEDIQDAEELICDSCGMHIGYVKSSDLNGSSFYCDGCKVEWDG